jgi:hypothetical protein
MRAAFRIRRNGGLRSGNAGFAAKKAGVTKKFSAMEFEFPVISRTACRFTKIKEPSFVDFIALFWCLYPVQSFVSIRGRIARGLDINRLVTKK